MTRFARCAFLYAAQRLADRRPVRALAALTIIAAISPAWAQSTSVRGTVTDPQKAVIPAARVTISEGSTGVSHSAVTSQAGEYQFLQIRPGKYTLKVEAPGFAVREVNDLQLVVDTPATLDVVMDIASSAATVSVTAEAGQLNTVDASIGNEFTEKKIDTLPIQTRNAVQLLSLQPGVTQNGEVMGARRDQNNITLDGVDNNDNQNALSGLNGNNQGGIPSPTSSSGNSNNTAIGFNSALPVPLDSVQEFRVTVAGQGADQGRSSGGQVSLVTRSGTNALHGTAYEYNRNTDYTANDWFNNRSGVARPQLVRNQFGASLGGPVKKDRIFYFLNYERRIDSSQMSVSQTVPSESLKQGLVKFQLNNGQIQTLNAADVANVDPLHLGISQSMLNILKQYPVGNDPALGADQGLNFTGLLFNAPDKLDYRTYVGRFDWVIDSQAKHTVSFRGTLSNQNQTNVPAQFPGQAAASQLLADNRGFGARYTAVLAPNVTNVANIGLTRIGYGSTGASGTALSFGDISSLQNYTRANNRINPTWNFNDDVTWVKGSHTIQAGINFRWINNNLSNFANSWPSYSFSRGILFGLGADINTAALNYVTGGAAGVKLANPQAVTNAMGDLLGLVDSLGVTYQYQRTGNVLAFGQPLNNDFITADYEGYIQDNWKVNPKLTVTFGLRYLYDTVPYEANGLQVGSNPGLNVYFANRVGAMNNGIPGNQIPGGDLLSYSLNGPKNGTSSWYKPDTNNFAPRLSAAYSLTPTTVIRAGASMVYDQYGNDLVANYASLGSVGLSTRLGFPTSYNFTTSPRYNGGSLPALPTAPQGGFPYTPPDIAAISGTFYGISPDLVAPYSYLLNFTVSHEFKHNLDLDMGYVGRLSRKLLLQQDVYSPAIYFKDQKSGQTWVQADTAMRQLYNGGLTPSAVKTNPSLVAANQFVQDMFPGLQNYYFPGSASANYFYGIYGQYGGSDLDNLHSLDRVRSAAFPNCIVATGCYTFFAPQGSADPTWTNSGDANYDALIVTLRRPFSNGLSFDFNYTWSHSIDNASAAANGAGQFGGVLQNAFMPGLSRASSDFDLRHQFNANIMYELPFGKGKMFLNTSNKLVNEVIGGWQVSSLIRVQSGLPSVINGSGVFPTNYWQSSLAIPNGAAPTTGTYIDNQGNPSIFQNISAISSYQDAFPGGVGTRGIVRLPWQKNVDLAVQKFFPLPWEGHTLQLRAEAFNAFNFVNFTNISLSLADPGTFGEFTNDAGPRVLQMALRYQF